MSNLLKISCTILCTILPLSLYAVDTNGRIQFGVSPIRHELKVNPGEQKTEEVKFINNSDIPYTLYLTVEDCTPDSNYGTPKCGKTPGSSSDPTKLSNWITTGGPQTFTVPPKGEQVVPFTINTPANASPGGYYGAIFFNNPDAATPSGSGTVGLVRRIGVLILTEVSGNIIINPQIGEITVTTGGGGQGGAGGASAGNSVLQNLLQNPLDRKNIEQLGNVVVDELDPFNSAPEVTTTPKDNFSVDFLVPISNSGNTHIKPAGKISIIDEEGNQMLKIGKETIKSPEGAFIGERIVDYIPINDELGNILPGTERKFMAQWLGFPYETIGADGTVVIEYKTPEEYFESMNNLGALYPWERIRVVERNRTLKAHIEISYADKDGKIQTEKYDKPVNVHYFEKTKGIHYGRVVLFLLVVWVFWMILSRRRDDRIAELEARLRADEDILEKTVRRKSAVKKGEEDIESAKPVGTRTKKVLKVKEEESSPSPVVRKRRKPPVE